VNPHFFGAMIEITGEKGESTGSGEGLSSSSPILDLMIKLVPGKFTLSRLVAGGIYGWRVGMTEDFTIATSDEGGALTATALPPGDRPEPDERPEVDYYPPTLFLAHIRGGEPEGFETRRQVAFDKKGAFTGEVDGGLVDDVVLAEANACLISSVAIDVPAGSKGEIIHAVGYSRANEIGRPDNPAHVEDKIERARKLAEAKMSPGALWREALPEVAIAPDWLGPEMVWHAYYLKAIATYDDYFRRRIMSQGCAYQYITGMNIAARDPLQHMLPMVYLEPELAKDVIRYTLSEMNEDGFIPYGIKGVGVRTAGGNPFPSDTNLYLMLSVTEYVTATRDFAFLGEVLPYYPEENGKIGTVMDHMRSAWRHQIDDVGIGDNGLIKLRNSDWNDSFLAEEKTLDPGLDMAEVEAEAESALNTAMATYILPRFAGLVRAGGDRAWADEIDAQADEFKRSLQALWTGEWYSRAILPNGKVVGEDRIYLSLQPWAILGGAPSPDQEQILNQNLHDMLSSKSPLGAVMRWPPVESGRVERTGKGTNGGIWYSLRFPLIMSYARQRPDWAWDELMMMTNHAHAEAYPDIWIGQWSGPDANNAEESDAPGWTWHVLPLSGLMMDFPVTCGHAHAAPWFSLIKLAGIHPTAEGFTIDPRIPESHYRIETELIEVHRSPNGIGASITPRGSSEITWRVRTPRRPSRVTASGGHVHWQYQGGFVIFRAKANANSRSGWEISW